MQFKHLARPLSRLLGASPADEPAGADPGAMLDSAADRDPAATEPAAPGDAEQVAAIGRLEDGEPLRTLAGLTAAADVAPTLERAAQARLAHLIDVGTVDFESLRADAVNVGAIIAVTGYASDPELPARALASIDPTQRRSLVLDGPSSRVRQLAAQSVSDPAELRQLLKQLHGKDKNVYKIIREKCDALNAEERSTETARADAIRAYESLERHSHRIYEAVYEPTLRHFHGRWESLEEHATPELRERAARAIARCREIVAEHHERQAREAAEASAQAARAAEAAAAQQHAELEAIRARETAQREAVETHLRREAEEAAAAAQTTAQNALLREIHALIGRAQSALSEGATGRASGLRRTVEEKLTALPIIPPQVARPLHKLDSMLGEMKAWKEHAAAPKRAELIQEMESLIGATQEPRVLAERIRQLQDDWKIISKGVLSDTDADWQRFHQAAEHAYQPCRDYFEMLAKQRRANAEKRRAILERLRAFESSQAGEAADWRLFATVLREAPLEWRRYQAIERAAARELQREFDAITGRLQERLSGWQTQNAEAKRALIQRAEALAALDDGREATDGAKRLQAQWKEIGAAAPADDRSLWEEFRGRCDALFQRRDQARADHTAGLQSNKTRAIALCEAAEQFAAQADAEHAAATAKIAAWRAAFAELGELPRADERSLTARLDRALERVKGSIAAQKRRDQQRSIQDLLEAAALIHAYGSSPTAAAEREALKSSAEAFIAGVSRWPKGGAEGLAAAWSAAQAAIPSESATVAGAAAEKALRLLCIRAELLTERATPAEDLGLRREYQMQRLVERMGKGEDPRADSVESLVLEWTRSMGTSAQVYRPLLERFRDATQSAH